MLVAPASRSSRPDLPFRYVSGNPSLDLVNTVDWASSGLVRDRLVDYPALTLWAEGADAVNADAARDLRAAGEARPQHAEAAMETARRARWMLHRLFSSLADGQVDTYVVDEFNEVLEESLRHLRVALRGGQDSQTRLEWAWNKLGDKLESPLWPVVRSAASLMTSSEASQVRMCGGTDCGWLFVDRSRNGLRRWCEMATCGTAAKTRRRAVRGGANERSADDG